jgi:hypothetical protein
MGWMTKESGSIPFLHDGQVSSRASRPPVQRVLGVVSPGVKCQGHEADHSSPSSVGVKNGGAIPALSQGVKLLASVDISTRSPWITLTEQHIMACTSTM